MGSAIGEYTCFNRHKPPRGHFYSSNQLHSLGIWVGYLAPEKQHVSFKGLPSFKQLKQNFMDFVQPFPSPTLGVAGGERSAVCRGCVHRVSLLLALEEINFVKKTKLIIMRLDGEDEEGMFCVLLPQPNDRSLPGLQSYRPFQHKSGSSGQFSSNVMLLALRNTSQQSSIVLDTVRSVLGVPPPEPQGIEDDQQIFSPPRVRRSTLDSDQPALERKASTSRTRKRSEDGTDETPPTRKRQRKTPLPHLTQQPALAPRGTSESLSDTNSGTPSSNDNTLTGRLPIFPAACEPRKAANGLTDEQAKLIRLVWIVEVDNVEYDFSHSLTSCDNLAAYLDLLREDAADQPEILAKVDGSTVWRLTYQLPGLPKKAFAVRLGDEAGFEKLLQSLAQSTYWQSVTESKVDVQFQVLK